MRENKIYPFFTFSIENEKKITWFGPPSKRLTISFVQNGKVTVPLLKNVGDRYPFGDGYDAGSSGDDRGEDGGEGMVVMVSIEYLPCAVYFESLGANIINLRLCTSLYLVVIDPLHCQTLDWISDDTAAVQDM